MNVHSITDYRMPRGKRLAWVKIFLLQVMLAIALLLGQLLIEVAITKAALQHYSELKKIFPEWQP